MIYLAVCTFAGHREVFSSSIEADIDCALEEIIQTDDDFIFYYERWRQRIAGSFEEEYSS